MELGKNKGYPIGIRNGIITFFGIWYGIRDNQEVLGTEYGAVVGGEIG